MVADAEPFEATCEGCGQGVELEPAEQAELIDERGAFRCEACRTPRWLARLARRGRPRVQKVDPWRRAGCIVTVGYLDGSRVAHVRGGMTVEDALDFIVDELPPGAWVESIATYRSIARDLKGSRRDPWAVERALLGRAGRLDLMPPRSQ